ncbi:MAG TPA: DUF6134 family protein [Gemmatimonadaceae bacterium]|jgi:hypothetical protein
MMSFRSLPFVHAGVGLLLGVSSLTAQARIIDEGTFIITRTGAPSETESFRIRADNGNVTATGQLNAGTKRVSSALTTDSLGTPVDYRLDVRENGASTMSISAIGRAGRLTARARLPRGDESTREYPVTTGGSVILEDDLVHLTYFTLLSKRDALQAINLRASHGSSITLRALGPEPLTIAGRQVTATHYSLQNGARQREFWVDSAGRLLQVEIPAIGLKATREELPR